MCMKQYLTLMRNRCYVSGLVALIILAAIHYQDVSAGAAATGDVWLKGQYALAGAAGIGAALLVGAALLRPESRLEMILPWAVGCFGILYSLVLPPLSAPDEMRHYISAYQMSNRMLRVSVPDAGGLVAVRAEDWFVEDCDGAYAAYLLEGGTLAAKPDCVENARILGQTVDEGTYRLLHDYRKSPMGREYLSDPGANGWALSNHLAVTTTPCAYLVPALGITIARLLHLDTIWLLYLGRLSNLVLFVGAVFLAIRRMPFGKEVLFGVSLLPMTLHLVSSFSYDVMILSGIYLFMAACLDLAYGESGACALDIVALAAIMAVVGPCKLVYTVLMGLCLLIPVRKFGSWGKWAVSAACVFVSWGAAMVLVNSRTVASYVAESENYIEWAGEAGYLLPQLVHQPMRVLRLFYNSVAWDLKNWHLMMLGEYLGNMDKILEIPYFVLLGLTGGLLALAFRKPGEQLEIRPRQRVWILVLCAACMGAMMFSMLLAWTPASSNMICGVQGRYFLPCLPVFLLALKNDTIVLTKNRNRSILYLMCCANAYVIMRLFGTICLRV